MNKVIGVQHSYEDTPTYFELTDAGRVRLSKNLQRVLKRLFNNSPGQFTINLNKYEK